MELREDIQEFIELIENRNHDVEIETYNYTIMKGELFDNINDFGLYLSKNINHEIMLDNLVINGNVIENKLSYKELSKLVDNDDPAIVNEIMKMIGLDVESSIQVYEEEAFKVTANNKIDAFMEWFEVYNHETYKQLTEMYIPGITTMEAYVDWSKLC